MDILPCDIFEHIYYILGYDSTRILDQVSKSSRIPKDILDDLHRIKTINRKIQSTICNDWSIFLNSYQRKYLPLTYLEAIIQTNNSIMHNAILDGTSMYMPRENYTLYLGDVKLSDWIDICGNCWDILYDLSDILLKEHNTSIIWLKKHFKRQHLKNQSRVCDICSQCINNIRSYSTPFTIRL